MLVFENDVKKISKSKKISIDAILISCSIILASLGNFTLPFLTFFKLDLSDITCFLATLLFGISHGTIVLFVTSIIRMFTGDVSTLTAFSIRMSSVIIILFLNIYRNSKKNFFILSILSTILMILVRLPLSYHMWINYFHVPKEIYFGQMKNCIIIMTFVRTLINLIISKFLCDHISKKIFKS